MAVSLWEPTVEQSMIDALAERLSARIGTGDGFSEEHLFQDGMGMRGVVHLDGIRKMAQPCVLIRRFYGLEYRLNTALHACARKRGHHVVSVHDPFDPSRLNGIYLPQSGVGFLIAEQIDAETHAIDLRRCVRRTRGVRCGGRFAAFCDCGTILCAWHCPVWHAQGSIILSWRIFTGMPWILRKKRRRVRISVHVFCRNEMARF